MFWQILISDKQLSWLQKGIYFTGHKTFAGINGPCVTSGPNGPELSENVSENENGDS